MAVLALGGKGRGVGTGLELNGVIWSCLSDGFSLVFSTNGDIWQFIAGLQSCFWYK